MGIKLVEEVMDWCPDDVTPAQRWCLTVLARDANDATRETWHGPEHPEILRRVRMSAKRWESVRSELLKRGLIEPVSGGYRGRTGRYRIACLYAPCVIADRRKTPENRGAFGGYATIQSQKDPRSSGVNPMESPPESGGQSTERPPESGGPTPLSLPSSSSPPPSDTPPAAPDRLKPSVATDERENPAAPTSDQAQQVAAAWTAARGGPRIRKTETTIAKAAADLLADGHELDHLCRVAAWMASRNYLRLDDAITHPDAPKPAGATICPIGRPQLPDWCGQCNDGDDTARAQPARRFINQPDGTSIRCHCHPAAARNAA